jgi:L-ascorbate metabolism protein UlaG (beta-lactamase superfamily)
LFLPIDWTHPIAAKAASFVELLRPRTVIPIHYWSRQAKTDFLSLLSGKNEPGAKQFLVEELDRPDYAIDNVGNGAASTRVISLEPAPFES